MSDIIKPKKRPVHLIIGKIESHNDFFKNYVSFIKISDFLNLKMILNLLYHVCFDIFMLICD